MDCDYEEINDTFDLSAFIPESDPIITKKDIYNRTFDPALWFVLIYDDQEEFKAFELHEGINFAVQDCQIDFSDDIFFIKNKLIELGYDLHSLDGSEENILVSAIKTNFASSNEMGGDGKELSYVYCAENIDHLLEEP